MRMEKPSVKFENVSKKYILRRRSYGLKSVILHLPQYINDLHNPRVFEALKSIDLEISQGETLGIIGHNGSGKTSLLSLIGNVIRPDSGRITVDGRISMMLSLGTGFCQELSGRENIILNGVLQGITRKRMNELMDDIIDFSGIEEFIDSPIFQYSSGMQTRLGFGIVTALQPEILLVDEVMAVGDVNFAKKCDERMTKLLNNGTTLLLVSHNMHDIRKYCKRVIRLDHGQIVEDGPTEDVLKKII